MGEEYGSLARGTSSWRSENQHYFSTYKYFFACFNLMIKVTVHGAGTKLLANWELNMLYTKR